MSQPQTYDAFLAGLAIDHAVQHVPGYRYGQRYFNSLPGPIAEVIRATALDPWEADEIEADLHTVVRILWDRT